MSVELTKLSSWVATQKRHAPTRAGFKVVRESGLGEELVCEFSKEEKDLVKAIDGAIALDLATQTGVAKYRVIALGGGETKEPLAVHRINLSGTSEGRGGDTSVNGALAALVKQQGEQTLNHYDKLFNVSMGLIEADKVELQTLRAENKDLIDQNTALMLRLLEVTLSGEQPDVVAQAKAKLLLNLSGKVDEGFAMARSLLTKRDPRSLPAPKPGELDELRKAFASLSDTSVALILRTAAKEYLEPLSALAKLASKEERDRLEPHIARLFGEAIS